LVGNEKDTSIGPKAILVRPFIAVTPNRYGESDFDESRTKKEISNELSRTQSLLFDAQVYYIPH
jgi:hypothetical protein